MGQRIRQNPAQEGGGGRQQGRRRGRGGHGGGGRGGFGQPRAQQHENQAPMTTDAFVRDDPMQLDATAAPPLTMAVPSDTPRFAELAGQNLVHPTIIQTITEDLQFDHMLPVQAATLKELLPPSRADCLVQAKTGTGKTVAFLLPALQNMISMNRPQRQRGASLLVIAPTRELAMQIAKEATRLLQRLPEYRVCIAIGGTDKRAEASRILKGCDILIATPGRLIDHMSDESFLPILRHLDTLVLDEADRLLDMGFMPDLKRIVSGLPDKLQTNRQGMLFSATIPPRVQEVAGIVLAPGYKSISTIPEGEVNAHERVPQLLITAPTFSLTAAAMVGAIREEAHAVTTSEGNPPFKGIVFSPTAALADYYSLVLANIGGMPPVSVLHSRMTQNKRTKVTNEFRLAQSAVLVTTDIIARGMDFPGVTSVLQVGLPADKESYIHRLGRTARAGAEGRGIFVVCEAESFFPKWSLKEMNLQPRDADLSSASEVAAIAAQMDEEQQARVYQAWLGYYKNFMKPLKWTAEELVAQGNIFARDGLSAPETPALFKPTVGKMGLKGVKGLRVVPAPQKTMPGRGGGGGRGGQGQGQSQGGGGGGRRRGGGQ
ncbi:ATP-dependent RNA helicase [Plectosphaerella plurivora]|uniref:ATP-dependent RNA helicase n=1 Tax=Plectosphaerella plurivora TaxID=936078 RepID=A0A9P9AGE5_9PEZI|nr:ATP-dependent RNA helicase [Plectosphaerella plurivora]